MHPRSRRTAALARARRRGRSARAFRGRPPSEWGKIILPHDAATSAPPPNRRERSSLRQQLHDEDDDDREG
eukprot:scaffold106_cov380-Prasinococcus_capsulatus_cf.AAC.3